MRNRVTVVLGVIASRSVRSSSGAIGHGCTYSGHPVGCAAGPAALAETKRLRLNENAAARGIELAAVTRISEAIDAGLSKV